MIKILSEDTIQKIAAGEVVERPASIIKELVENSIDAKSDDIIVEIKNGGKTYIKVSDNGTGIQNSDVKLAFERHATSKISNFEDLYKIYSMGFRGEALASIISVSKLVMKTKHLKEDIGTQIQYDNNKLVSESKIATNTGTTIEVFDLFKYVPARQRFLASDITESNKITNLLYTFAIGNPDISFTYIKDNKEMFTTNKNSTKKENLQILFGRDFIKNSIDIESSSVNYQLKGTISNNKYYKGNRSMQYIYVNGRYIENEGIVEAIESAYHLLIPNGRFPLFEIKIEVNPDLIDVNIHPNKQKIKFSFNEEIIKLITETITKALYDNEKSKDITHKEEENKTISFHELNKGDTYQKILDAYHSPTIIDELPIVEETNESLSNKEYIKFIDLDEENKIEDIQNDSYSKEYDDEETIKNEQIEFDIKDLDFKSILFNKFLLFENQRDNNIKIIDIYRANIRIIYDNEKNKQEIVSQDLLEPIIVNITSKELELFNQNKDLFKDLGYDAQVFGDNSIIIRAIPYYLELPSTIKDFKLLLDDSSLNLIENKKSYFLRSAVSKSIYKNNIKNEDEALLFFEELFKTSNPYTDPNGKTIVYKLSYEDFIKILKS